MKTIQELYDVGKDLLGGGSEAGLEARVLLCKSASIGEEDFYAQGERKVSRAEERQFLKLISRRLSAVPLSYLTSEKEFWSLSFDVFPGVLIPRPESELIVEKVLEFEAKERKTREISSKADKSSTVIADIGTGSGNIAIALARELLDSQIVASDTSRTALKIARMNALKLKVSNVIFAYGSLFVPLDRFKLQGKCDFIVCNPPYVAEDDWKKLQPEVRDFEPKRALVAGKTGLEFIQKLAKGAPKYLRPGGFLIFEIGFGQEDEVLCLLNTNPKWTAIQCFDDLNKIPRVVVAQISSRSNENGCNYVINEDFN
jgi:release factor glutamine methyltransferase